VTSDNKRAIQFGSLLIIVALAFLGRERVVGWFAASSSKIAPATLREELVRIPVPLTHERVGEIKTFDRATSTAAVVHYSVAEPPKRVIEAYRASLEHSDWKFSDQQIVGGRREVRAKFCKGNMSLTVDAQPVENSSTYYYLGVAWAQAKQAPAHCGK
jgi:hypothetical protein